MKKHATAGRRTFMKEAALVSAGIVTTPLVSTVGPASLKEQQSIYLIGPQKGYSPQI
ncbi:twin-arginine translocation signal domain-containing protein [Catalinimonas sp. 4WD22]|uniref:twin-arginine translocation signal domain-containing protein n=1 Tax=Catalinimonas locisalis TaxID=3133978 RepID=UPI003101B16F